MIADCANNSSEERRLSNPFIKLGTGAKIIDSVVVGGITLDSYACINRCNVGRYFGMGSFSYVARAQIGRYCTFGSRVSVGAFSHPTDWLSIHEFQYRDTSGIYGDTILEGSENIAPKNPITVIGNDIWIGDNASVKAGVALGDGCIVGLGSVVVSDVPPYAIVCGNPAKIIRYRFNQYTIKRLLELEWWRLDMKDLKGIDFSDVERAISKIPSVVSAS